MLTRRSLTIGGALLLAGCRQQLLPGAAPTRENACPSQGGTLRFLTWNVFLMPPLIGESPRNRERASVIADVLSEEEFDVLCLQKVFDGAAREVLEQKLAPRYPYRFGPANDSCSLKLNSGVFIASRVPLGGRREIQFDPCGAVECFSRKGAMYLEGTCGPVPFRLVATHLQGDEGKEYAIMSHHIRQSQLRAIRDELIAPHRAPATPFILCGDFCTPRFTEPYRREHPHYASMLRILGAENGAEPRVTLDDSRANQLAMELTGRKNELDYILVRKEGCPLHVVRRARIFRRGGWDDRTPERTDLSYRYAVEAFITLRGDAQP